MGCFGPGKGSDYAQACSRKPRQCGELAVINMASSQKGFGGFFADLFGSGTLGFKFQVLLGVFDYFF